MMFNDKHGLTKTVLYGRKRMTRRICEVQRPSDEWRIVFPIIEQLINYECLPNSYAWRNDKTEEYTDWCVPRYKVGEIVAVAQSYESINENYFNNNDPMRFYYKQQTENLKGWNNKMFVRADLMPHQIQITTIRLERLQDISDEDCIAEGIDISPFDYGFWDKNKIRRSFSTPREAYAALIDKVSGKGTWESNPYVFVYEFKLTD